MLNLQVHVVQLGLSFILKHTGCYIQCLDNLGIETLKLDKVFQVDSPSTPWESLRVPEWDSSPYPVPSGLHMSEWTVTPKGSWNWDWSEEWE